MIFTVIGYYESDGQKYLGHIEATSGEHSLQIVSALHPDQNIMVCAVIEGRHVDTIISEYVDDLSELGVD